MEKIKMFTKQMFFKSKSIKYQKKHEGKHKIQQKTLKHTFKEKKQHQKKNTNFIANFPLGLVAQKRPPQVPKSFIKCRQNTVFWGLVGAFFGEPT
jgi:hypothetical protein